MLTEPHSYAEGGVSWAVLSNGISIEGKPPQGTRGPPDTAKRVLAWFGPAIEAAASAYGVPRELLVAIICNESAGGEPLLDLVMAARREEPGYQSDALTPDRISTGCCQTLLSTAREVLDNPALTSLELTIPENSIMAAAAYIASQAKLTDLDPVKVAAAYNSGGLYPEPTEKNRWGLRCYPLNTGQYIDRFVAWYNDAVAVLS